MASRYHLHCVACDQDFECSPVRYQKWQIRLRDPNKHYTCKVCRRKLPKEIRVTIPDEAISMAEKENMTDTIRQIHGIQVLTLKRGRKK